MASLWHYGPVQFTVNAGEKSVLELAVPRRGTLRTLNVAQLDGGDDTGELTLFDSQDAVQAFLGDGADSVSESGEGTDAALCHGIADPFTVTDGKILQTGLNLPYVNRDGTNAQPVRRLWGLLDIPSGSGQLTFAVSMVIEQVTFR